MVNGYVQQILQVLVLPFLFMALVIKILNDAKGCKYLIGCRMKKNVLKNELTKWFRQNPIIDEEKLEIFASDCLMM